MTENQKRNRVTKFVSNILNHLNVGWTMFNTTILLPRCTRGIKKNAWTSYPGSY